MNIEEQIKELRELYIIAKKKGEVLTAFSILTKINQLESGEDDPCGAKDFRKQADEKAD